MKPGTALLVRNNISRGLTLLKGAVPEGDCGLLHTAPTYVSRSPRNELPTVVVVPLSRPCGGSGA